MNEYVVCLTATNLRVIIAADTEEAAMEAAWKGTFDNVLDCDVQDVHDAMCLSEPTDPVPTEAAQTRQEEQ